MRRTGVVVVDPADWESGYDRHIQFIHELLDNVEGKGPDNNVRQEEGNFHEIFLAMPE